MTITPALIRCVLESCTDRRGDVNPTAVAEELTKLFGIRGKLKALDRDDAETFGRHEQERHELVERRSAIQATCPHYETITTRGTAESDSRTVCELCGKETES